MKGTRSEAYARLKSRRNPENDATIYESFDALPESEAIKYLAGAMEPIPEPYTVKTKQEAERVQNQITKGLAALSLSVEFELQGSVVKNTHIRGYSDIDVLTLDSRFFTLESPQSPPVPYTGDPLLDLLQIRKIIEDRLTSSFPEAVVDKSRAKAVKISGGSLHRDVDVVIANWYHTIRYSETKLPALRGVQILDVHAKTREKDQPFLHGAWLDDQDRKTNGNSKKLIRLFKSIKYDSDSKNPMSSFDIESLVFRMVEEGLRKFLRGQELALAFHGYQWLHQLDEDVQLRVGLMTPDNKRQIFCDGHATLTQLREIKTDLAQLLNEVQKGLAQTARRLTEARLEFPVRPWYYNVG